MHRPKIPKNPKILRTYQARPWQSSKKSWDSWESWACAWILHYVHQESWESWACAGLVSFLHLWSHKTCPGPRFPRFLMNKVQDSCTGPRFPRIPRFWGTIRQDPGKVPKNLGILANLGPVHESCTLFIQDSWESWACAGLVSFPHHWSHKTCTGPRFPRFLMNKVQDSCTGPRFPRIPRFLGTIKQDPDKVPKNLGILGNLGPVHESCTLFIGILGNLGPVQVLWRSYVKLFCLFEKMHFPCVFSWWTSELVQRVFIFWWNFWKWRTGFWFCIIGCFLRQMIAIEIIIHTVYSKNTGIYSGFCMCHKLQDEDEDTYVIHPLLQVGPGRGGDHIYIYIYIYNHLAWSR